jgi:hypothetical protein
MKVNEKLLKTLDFEMMPEGGAVLETFFPWGLTVNRWCEEGLPERFHADKLFPDPKDPRHRYLYDCMAKPVYEYEQYLGLDGVKRIAFRIPFQCFEEVVLEETDAYVLKRDLDGWHRKYYKNSNLIQEIKPVVRDMEEWQSLKHKVVDELEKYCTDENINEIYGQFKEGHEAGEFSIRFRISGFFWTPRQLLGIEEHMFAFYDMPEVIMDMNQFIVDMYIKYLGKIFDIIKPEVILLEEDLSGSNGPMLSPEAFDEFVGAYYKKLFPFLKSKGVKNIFVDTDGDFNQLIPNFIQAGVDGFLPMDVNAGMDIVLVRKKYPALKFIGAYNKLEIAKGKEAIDKEFERILPVIRQGGYVPGADHQVAPSTSFENYKYYLTKLKEVMVQAGADH